METEKITLPYNWTPREYQIPVLRALDNGFKRAVLVWHRRAGKDLTLLNYIAKKAWERVGVYYHLLPTYAQGKKIVWDGMTREGRKFLSYFPPGLIKKKNDSEMKIEFLNGSIYQIIGTDNFDSVVGPNPIGCVFSEYSLQNPTAWDLIRPILAENQGWAAFAYTPRGENHGYRLFQVAQKSPEDWFCQFLTIRDTRREDNTPVVREDDVQREIRDGMDSDLAQQEFYCSWTAPKMGAYFGKQLTEAEKDGRIGNVPWEPNLPVDTWWDLGIGDAMAIWFTQVVHREVRVIDYYETSGEGLSYYAKLLKEKPYVYGTHHMPHDAQVKELGTGKSRKEVAESLGIRPIDVVKNLPVDDGIDAARALLSRCWFDRTKCEQGLNALKSYHKEWDDNRKEFKNQPYHDWASHSADAFRYLAVGHRIYDYRMSLGVVAETEFDVFAPNYGHGGA